MKKNQTNTAKSASVPGVKNHIGHHIEPGAEPYASPCHCSTLRQTTRAVTRFYDQALEPGGLRVTQYSLLNRLQRHGPSSMSELSAFTMLERTTLIRNLNPLVKRGLISITASGRAHRVEVTGKGAAELEKARALWENAQKGLEERLSGEELESFRNTLRKLCGMST